MEINRKGCTRIVVLTKRYAFKIPNFMESWGDKWRLFLSGLLANQQEWRFWSRGGYPELCPIRFYVPFGFLVVMPRVREMTDSEFDGFDIKAFVDKDDYYLPIEQKPNSLGFLNGRVVAIDYGN